MYPVQANTSCEYNSIIVTLKSMIEDIGFITYSLEMKTKVLHNISTYYIITLNIKDEGSSSRQLTLFHYQEWSAEASRPNPGSSLLDLFESVVKNQSKTGNKPIVVICK